MTTETALKSIWNSLTRVSSGERFDPQQLNALPEPARRYLLHAIAPGTVLASSVELNMSGAFCPSPGGRWIAMTASEVIASNQGFLWKAKMGRLLPIVGFDRYSGGEGELSWRLGGLLPLVHAQSAEVSRAARGRLAAELVWLPSALLPGPEITWRQTAAERAEVAVTIDGDPIRVEMEIEPDGRLRRLRVNRWTDFGSPGHWHLAPFAACVEEEAQFGGYTIPGRMSAGWWGEAGWQFEFFRAEVTSAVFR